MGFAKNFAALMDLKLDAPIGAHLRNVYSSVACASFMAGVGSTIHVNGIWQGGMLSALGSLGFFLMLAFSRQPDGSDSGIRFMYLNGLALCTGLSTGRLVEAVWTVNPAIVISALLYTCVIFTCFSISALIAPEGKYLALGAPLMSILSTMVVAYLMNIFIRSASIAYLQGVMGLVVLCMFILYDTHLIMEKFRMGDRDFVWHGLTLFLDFWMLFKDILVQLAPKKDDDCDDRR